MRNDSCEYYNNWKITWAAAHKAEHRKLISMKKCEFSIIKLFHSHISASIQMQHESLQRVVHFQNP